MVSNIVECMSRRPNLFRVDYDVLVHPTWLGVRFIVNRPIIFEKRRQLLLRNLQHHLYDKVGETNLRCDFRCSRSCSCSGWNRFIIGRQ
jgi:hypothetical protein